MNNKNKMEPSEGDISKTVISTTDQEQSTNNINNNESELSLPIIPQEKTLNSQIILDSVALYNKLSTPFSPSSSQFESLSEEDKIKAVLQSKILLIPGKRIEKIASLEVYEHLEELYLNLNFIKAIEGLNYLTNLQVLNLKGNRIEKIENITHLIRLQVLDLSDNYIQECDVNEIPLNIIYIYLFTNPFFENIDYLAYRSKIIRKCQYIERIDKLDISDRERLILIEESNLKRTIKGLNNIKEHYDKMANDRKEKYEEIKSKIDKDYDDLKQGKLNKETINELPKQQANELSSLTEEKLLNMESFLSQSLVDFEKVSVENKAKSQARTKNFLESKEVKELHDKLKELTNKFTNTTFKDSKAKELFEERINRALAFKDKIIGAENTCKEIVQKLNEQSNEINTKLNQEKEEKELEVVIEDEDEKEKEMPVMIKDRENKLLDHSLLSESDMSMLDELNKNGMPK